MQPFTFVGQPDVLMYRLPDNCVEEYRVGAPHHRPGIGVALCWKTVEAK